MGSLQLGPSCCCYPSSCDCDAIAELTGLDVDITIDGVTNQGGAGCSSGCPDMNGTTLVATFQGTPSSIVECSGGTPVSDCSGDCSNATYDTAVGDTGNSLSYTCNGAGTSINVDLVIVCCSDDSFLLMVQATKGFGGYVCWLTTDLDDIGTFLSGGAVVLPCYFSGNYFGCNYTSSTATIQLA